MSLEVAVESCRLQVKEYTQKGTKCNFKCLRCDYLGRDKSDCRRHLQAYPGCLAAAQGLAPAQAVQQPQAAQPHPQPQQQAAQPQPQPRPQAPRPQPQQPQPQPQAPQPQPQPQAPQPQPQAPQPQPQQPQPQPQRPQPQAPQQPVPAAPILRRLLAAAGFQPPSQPAVPQVASSAATDQPQDSADSAQHAGSGLTQELLQQPTLPQPDSDVEELVLVPSSAAGRKRAAEPSVHKDPFGLTYGQHGADWPSWAQARPSGPGKPVISGGTLADRLVEVRREDPVFAPIQRFFGSCSCSGSAGSRCSTTAQHVYAVDRVFELRDPYKARRFSLAVEEQFYKAAALKLPRPRIEYLFHGTKSDAIVSILEHGFSRTAGWTSQQVKWALAGDAVYGAECSNYSLTYMLPADQSQLEAILPTQGIHGYMLLFRAVLFKATQNTGTRPLDGSGYTQWQTSAVNCTHPGSNLFAVYHEEHCYPNYVLCVSQRDI